MRNGPYENSTAIDLEIIPSKKRIGDSDISKSFPVNRYDIDSNNHVNNVRYMQWLMESIPDEFFNKARMQNIQGSFLKKPSIAGMLIRRAKLSPRRSWCIQLPKGTRNIAGYCKYNVDLGVRVRKT